MVKLRLKDILKARGISQSEFADKFGVSVQYINGICSGRITVSLTKLAEFAETLNVPLRELFADDSTMEARCPHCRKLIRIIKAEE